MKYLRCFAKICAAGKQPYCSPPNNTYCSPPDNPIPPHKGDNL